MPKCEVLLSIKKHTEVQIFEASRGFSMHLGGVTYSKNVPLYCRVRWVVSEKNSLTEFKIQGLQPLDGLESVVFID